MMGFWVGAILITVTCTITFGPFGALVLPVGLLLGCLIEKDKLK